MHEVLLLGDSMRMAYQAKVVAELGSDFNVSAPAENCRFAAYTLNSLRFWLNEYPNPEIIHWNNGLWDTAILYHEDGCFTSLPDYIDTLAKILRVLKSTGAKVIFASSTPVDPRKELITTAMPPCHHNIDIERYNEHALKLMRNKGIEVDDLWSVVYPHIGEYICDDLIHPTETGKEVLGRVVANVIRNSK